MKAGQRIGPVPAIIIRIRLGFRAELTPCESFRRPPHSRCSSGVPKMIAYRKDVAEADSCSPDCCIRKLAAQTSIERPAVADTVALKTNIVPQ